MMGDSQATPIQATAAATSRLRSSTCTVTAPASTTCSSGPMIAPAAPSGERMIASITARLGYSGGLLSISDGAVEIAHLLLQEAAGLALPQPPIGAAPRQQLAVRTGLHDAAVVQHHQPIHPRDGGKPVRDGDHRAPSHQPFELLLDRRLDLGIE